MKITIIGAGAMGGAMAEGLLQSEKFTPSDIRYQTITNQYWITSQAKEPA